ncbi:alpha/beta fold hydrolase [Amycolatopsis endophytica]|uniref:Pimeloyl-ACP methyl ester carboxylesterase n=1 Tax=Amycolatopsis endophytica TaxID=860233 RepID=A0A853BC81_9PSEU|nr:alpha/beta hydrolase [Amycolatopsis endophytica]NYI92364.1 pimeloyl-ACP methyl ester carboxylesterase [Amycolatopsis endophytica]
MLHDELSYTSIPERVRKVLAELPEKSGDSSLAQERLDSLGAIDPPKGNHDGEIEVVDGVPMTHRFVEAPGDAELLSWHLVEAGAGEPVVYLHGIPDSWYMWHKSMADLSATHHVIAIDLKGYGQSDKRRGDYRHEGVAGQLASLLDVLGLGRINLVTHDRGTVQADYLAANDPYRVIRYVRGEQHLFHYNPELSPQEHRFADPVRSRILANPGLKVAESYTYGTRHPIDDAELRRAIQEFSYPGIPEAVPRYFNSSSFRLEWIERRTRLIEAWRAPVLVLQGKHDFRQPSEFYEGVEAQLPPGSRVHLLDGGHFWAQEVPDEYSRVVREFITGTPAS